jgi:hypothetical protein
MSFRNTILPILAAASLLAAAPDASAQQLAFVAHKYLPASLEERDRLILVLLTRDARAPISESELRVAVPAIFRENGFMIRDTSYHRVMLINGQVIVRVAIRENGLVTIRGEQRCANLAQQFGRFTTYRLESEARRRYLDAASLIPDLRRVAEEVADLPACVEMQRIAAFGRGRQDTSATRRNREVEERRREADRAPSTGGTPPGREEARRPPLKEN